MAWNFEHPMYLLLDIGLEHMSALLRHRAGEDVKVNILGKVPVFALYRFERGLPLTKVGTGVSVVSQMRCRLFNPWHTLYQTNGRNWSCTLLLGAAGLAPQTECP
jgi:hypothetical protein